jgi:hypothetical protein
MVGSVTVRVVTDGHLYTKRDRSEKQPGQATDIGSTAG